MTTATMRLPTFETYGNYSSGNYGVHALVVSIGQLDIYFSYKTVVAFRDGCALHVRENAWGPTIGKHLNAIDGGSKEAKKKRLPCLDFEAALAETLAGYGLTK